MKIAEFAIEKRVITLTLTVVTIGAGLMAYEGLARLEDPEFTIKQALVITPYPGASPYEVEEEVTDKIEQAVQQLGQLKRIKESRSERGKSTVTVEIKDKYDKTGLPQVWDELRRKVSDVQKDLPPGAGPSLVVDDFGDVWGVFFALYGNEYSHRELYELAKFLRREFTLVQDVAKVQIFANIREVIYIELNRDRMSQLGIPPETIAKELQAKNIVSDAGKVEFGPERISIEPTGNLETVEAFGSILLTGGGERQIYLRDVATIRRGYEEPPDAMVFYDGAPAIGIGISTVAGGNVVVMGEAIEKRSKELAQFFPAGVEVGVISLQSDAVVKAIDNFVVSLYQAVLIVVVVLLFFMGLRSGVLIGFILFLTICGTFIVMQPWGVALERISLGALIISLGMLVDNAIVIVDGFLVRSARGEEPEQAALDVVSQNAMPLLGATVVAVLAFAAIGTSQDSTGEFCRSLFQVVFASLMLSWVTAVTVTPLLCILFLSPKQEKAGAAGMGKPAEDEYGGAGYGLYRTVLHFCLRFRGLTIAVVLGLFAVSLWGFGYVDQSFFPNSTRPQFMLDFWMPQGTRIEETQAESAKVEEYLHTVDGVTHVTSVLGQGAMRFLVTYESEKANPAYAQFLVDVEDYTQIDRIVAEVEAHLKEAFPSTQSVGKKFRLGPGDGGKIQIRAIGDDPKELRRIASEIETIMFEDGSAKGIRIDWRDPVKRIVPRIAEEQANLNGITRPQLSENLRMGFEGLQVGVYREGDELLPIIARAPEAERGDVASMQNLQIWSYAAAAFIPIRQVISGFDTIFEDTNVMRRNRKRTITVHCDEASGTASVLLARLMTKVDEIPLPPGYVIEKGGEWESSDNAQQGLAATIPVFLLLMILVVIGLFNALRQPLIIWLCVPLAIIGVTWGLLATKQPFGFMALLGFMSLSGMLIKNAIVLIDQIDLEIREGKDPFGAIVDSGVSRLRPVAMAALTTVLGMIPLLSDAFFVAMAVTIMAGLSFATLLTMILVPVLYATFFRIPYGGAGGAAELEAGKGSAASAGATAAEPA
ncbi:MAG: efflux RND transporter permease subunit [Deltaproteobacteria bacterium]|nr:efflux RND transporter permease subunit [Deltaproteobacteria bacterium]